MTEKPCIMPEMPYCPACKYGLIVPIDETECEWKCLYDGRAGKAMREKPKCPYCGAEMIRTDDITTACMSSRYTCRECGSAAPQVRELNWENFPEVPERARETALSAALHRAEPEMRPLTLNEIYAKIDDEDWNVVWIEGPDSQKAEPMCPYYKEENKIVFCAPPFVRVWEETISRYGKSWRCWTRKPTPEQMAAEKWEE